MQNNVFVCQAEEIHKHKWIESEKVGHDVGELWASFDWVSKYAVSFRENFERQETENRQNPGN
jgi:hypothetical protein